MQSSDNNTRAFLELVRAGLWEKEVQIQPCGKVDYEVIMRLAEEQSVMGLVTAGLEHVEDATVGQGVLLQFVGQTIQLETRNKAMNHFIAALIDKLRCEGIYALLVKGQGIAQCYERPLWRAPGDVDLFLDVENYKKASVFLSGIATSLGEEMHKTLHLDMSVEGWPVELHGTLGSQLNEKIDCILLELQDECFCKGRVRSWRNGETDVLIPAVDNDVIFVFTHILQHLFKGGIGIRQVCDWCRLLWTYRESLNRGLLESRIKKMGLMTEWKTFASLAVNTLGMPEDEMPLYEKKYKKKSEKLLGFILEVGNFGHNRELCYTMEQTAFVRKYNITKAQLKDSIRLMTMFPMDAPMFFLNFFWEGLKKAV